MTNDDLLSIDLCAIGNRIRAAREHKSITQNKLAEATELSVSHISDIENGKVNFSVDILNRLASALACSADYILSGVDCSAFELNSLCQDCSPGELTAIITVVKEFKESMRRNIK